MVRSPGSRVEVFVKVAPGSLLGYCRFRRKGNAQFPVGDRRAAGDSSSHAQSPLFVRCRCLPSRRVASARSPIIPHQGICIVYNAARLGDLSESHASALAKDPRVDLLARSTSRRVCQQLRASGLLAMMPIVMDRCARCGCCCVRRASTPSRPSVRSANHKAG